ncbi:MAG: hypothetical protein GSR72_00750 [Desulfurococcales archaeon]|nr:hypothetical protein [Desulfurococcales archaeon]MEB3788404.1 hypothetical protein [Desulfurococcales archaeon]
MVAGVSIDAHIVAGIIIGFILGSILAVLSYIGGFEQLSMPSRGLAGSLGSAIIAFLLLPLVQLRIGVLSTRKKIEYVAVSVLMTLVFWPVIYAVLIS